jgi:hypothetical protein
MNTIYLAQMKWCEREEPICAGTNKRKVSAEALRILKAEHGSGAINRGQAMCSVKITTDDIEIVEIPFLANTKVEARGNSFRITSVVSGLYPLAQTH